jgi:hypothetical protein
MQFDGTLSARDTGEAALERFGVLIFCSAGAAKAACANTKEAARLAANRRIDTVFTP